MFTYSPGLPCLDHRFDSERRQAEEEDPCGPTSSCSLHASWRTPIRPGYRGWMSMDLGQVWADHLPPQWAGILDTWQKGSTFDTPSEGRGRGHWAA